MERLIRVIIVSNRFIFGKILKFPKKEIRAIEKIVRSKYVYEYRVL